MRTTLSSVCRWRRCWPSWRSALPPPADSHPPDSTSCTLVPRQSDGPEQIGTILEAVSVAGARRHLGRRLQRRRGVGSSRSPSAGTGPPGSQLQPRRAAGPHVDLVALRREGVRARRRLGGRIVAGRRPADPTLGRHAWRNVATPAIAGTERILTGVDGTSADGSVGRRTATRQRADARGRPAPYVGRLADDRAAERCGRVPRCRHVADWGAVGRRMVDRSRGLRAGAARGQERATPGRGDGPRRPPSHNVFVLSLAVGSPGAVWAVGFSNDSPDGNTPVTMRRGDGGWTSVAVADQGGSARLSSVATGPAGTVAVGQVTTDGRTRALAIRLTDGGWTPIPGAGRAAARFAGRCRARRSRRLGGRQVHHGRGHLRHPDGAGLFLRLTGGRRRA